MKPRILFFDIETSPNLAYVWGKYEQNVLDYEKEWEILSVAYKWQGDSRVSCMSRPQYRDKTDRSLLKDLWKLFDEADIVIAHNGDNFDVKKVRARFAVHGLPPPSPFRSVDTKKAAKGYFNFNSNKLDDLGRILKVGRKMKHTGFELWLGCLRGDAASWRTMVAYNKRDVLLLERVYKKLLPWINNHPNVSQIADKPAGCPKCGSPKLIARGRKYLKSNVYRQFSCLTCGGWCRANTPIKLKKPGIVNL